MFGPWTYRSRRSGDGHVVRLARMRDAAMVGRQTARPGRFRMVRVVDRRPRGPMMAALFCPDHDDVIGICPTAVGLDRTSQSGAQTSRGCPTRRRRARRTRRQAQRQGSRRIEEYLVMRGRRARGESHSCLPFSEVWCRIRNGSAIRGWSPSPGSLNVRGSWLLGGDASEHAAAVGAAGVPGVVANCCCDA
jgi:hypothetical protein